MLKTKKKPKVFVTRVILGEGIALLHKHFQVVVRKQSGVISKTELYHGAKEADALLCLLTDHIDRAFLERNRHLKIIANYAVGFDNIDIETATRLGIVVTNTPGVLNEAVAEHTLALICALARRIPQADAFVRAGKYRGWDPLLFIGSDFFDKTLGIVGLGHIGLDLAKRASQGLGFKLVHHDLHPNSQFERHYGARYVSLPTLLKLSDFVSMHVPLLDSTHHLIGARELRMMKRTSYLINTSRGPVIDEKALVQALRKGVIAGAALDVFEHEPKLTTGLTRLPNVVLTPHIASATVAARGKMSVLAAQGIVQSFAGKQPENIVNPLVWRRALLRLA